MNRLAICLIAAVAVQTTGFAEVTKLKKEHREALNDSSAFREVYSTTNLPPAVIALCADENGRLADRDKKWETTDAITDSKLPRKRFIWGATRGEYYIIHYERGGVAHSYHVLIATLKEGEEKAKVVWRGVGDRLKDFKAFLAALKSNKLDDTQDYAH
jgi:hypothetical protein